MAAVDDVTETLHEVTGGCGHFIDGVGECVERGDEVTVDVDGIAGEGGEVVDGVDDDEAGCVSLRR